MILLENSFAAINYTLTPIRYELEMQPGESIVLPATIKNNGDSTVILPITTSDFQSNGTSGIPSLVRRSELVFPNQELSTWITLESQSITLNPGKEGTVNFNISVPMNATPGGHYGAVIFNTPNAETSNGGTIGINVDYGIIILVNISGEIVIDIDIDDPIIGGSGRAPRYDRCPEKDTSGSSFDGFCAAGNINPVAMWVSSNESLNNIPWYQGMNELGNKIYLYPDSCPFGDLTKSKYDGQCISFNPTNGENTISDINIDSKNNISNNIDEFEVSFTFPINNKGNTHIKPEGKVILKGDTGNIINAIGKETIINDRGAIIGEKIVDYIPINDEGGNILPGTKRIFESLWKGFPYKSYDSFGNQVVNYWSPSEFYTQQNKENAGFLMFWQRVSETRQHKIITADIEMIYYDVNGNPITFTTSQDFPVQYIEDRVTNNPYVILTFILVIVIIGLTGIAFKFGVRYIKKRKCWNCYKKIKSHWVTCPYCKTLQNKKKQKKLEESQEKQNTEKRNTKTRVKTIKKSPVKKIGQPRKVNTNI